MRGRKAVPAVLADGEPNGGESLAFADPGGSAAARKPGPQALLVEGGSGNDILFGTPLDDNVLGHDGDDYMNGLAGNDFMDGGAGNDAAQGDAGNDIIFGGDDNDNLLGEGDDDYLNGGNGADYLDGGTGNDAAEGGAGNDNLVGGDGNDNLLGGDDSDYINGGIGADFADGGNGNDAADGGAGNDNMYGGAGNDNLIGGADDDYLNAGAGTDYIEGGLGKDVAEGGDDFDILFGLEGDDILLGNAGDDYVYGGEANDILLGGDGLDYVNGGAGADYAEGGIGNDAIEGEAGNDIIYGNDGADNLIGGDNDDYLNGGAGGDFFDGGTGNDAAEGTAGNDIMFGGDGNDNLLGGDNDDYMNGGIGVDFLDGGIGNDAAEGGAGNDNAYGGDGNDNLLGGDDDDYLNGGIGVDFLDGGAGNDTADGGAGNDNLLGGDGIDTLLGGDGDDNAQGGAGDDTLFGNLGLDTLVGGSGADRFVFDTAIAAANIDAVSDFTAGTDKLLLAGDAGQPFAALAVGTLRAGTLVIGAAAADADDYLIYNSASGALSYDADGNGAGAAVQFATLASGLSLTVADFLVTGAVQTAPAITSGSTASIAENSAASTVVYPTAASDANGDRITYTLTGTDAALLNIDQNGAVRLNNPADFETKASYSFNVVASDSNTATSKAVTLTITDVADNPATPTINETASSNDAIGQAQAIDRNTFLISTNPNLPNDDLPSATIIGSISTDPDKDFFSITLQAGEQLILDVDGTTTLDSFLTIYGTNQVAIGDNDDLVSPDPGSGMQFGHNTDSQIFFRAATSGTYYFSIESFNDDQGPTSNGAYQINVSIGPPATPAQLQQEDVNALVSGSEWDHPNLTYGFPTMASQYPASFDEVSPASEFVPFTAAQQAATRQLLQLVANVSTLTFSELTGGTDPSSGAGAANLRYAMSTDDDVEVAYAYYPSNNGSSSSGGSAWFNTDDFNNPVRGNYAWMGILHESGHALGLKHGHEFPLAISADHDSVEYSVMTYRSFPGQSLAGGGGYTNEQFGYPQTLMMLDIAALQQIYDANYAFNAGNTVYSWTPNSGDTLINGVTMGQVGTGGSGTSNRVFLTIWDGNGTDTYDLSAYSSGTTIDLRPGEWTTTSAAQIASLSSGGGHMARGNVANALLHDGDTRSLIENAIGGGGSDQIHANQAKNTLTGNGGTDTFVWHSVADAGLGAGADVVTDFIRSPEHLDLSAIDAISATQADDAFSYIGTGAFTGVAGQLRSQVVGSDIHVFGDVNGDSVADFQIIVNSQTTLLTTDFIL